MLRRLWEPDGPRNPLWATCGNAFLAQALDQLFRVYSDPRVHGADPAAWARVHGRVLEDVLAGRARVEVNAQGVVVAADTSAHSYTLRLGGGTGADNAAVIGRPDTVRLLAGQGDVDPVVADPAVGLELALGPCLGGVQAAPPGARTPEDPGVARGKRGW